MGKLRRLAEKRTWTEKDGQDVIAAWRASGQTMASFAREHGVGDGRLRWWRDRVGGAGSGASAPVEGPRLVRVEIEQSAGGSAIAAVAWELVTARGQLRVHEGIEVGALRVVLEALLSGVAQ